MRICINAIASTAGGGKTYLIQLLRWLRDAPAHDYEIWLPRSQAASFNDPPANIAIRTSRLAHWGFPGRLLWEQAVLPWRLRRRKTDVLFCAGNFCPLWTRVPVVLLSANALYFSPRYAKELLRRRHWGWALRHALKGKLAVWSARAARQVVTPTKAMADYLQQASRKPLERVHPVWFGHHEPPAPRREADETETAETNEPGGGNARPFRFLILSFYNYFRNFETVFQAMARLRERSPRPVKLVLTTELRPGLKLGGYDTTQAWRLLRRLKLADTVECLGHVPYERLAETYARADALICAGYIESFSFTLVEGMANGVPVLASGIPAHREVAGGAALFFSPLDAEDLTAQCLRLIEDPCLRERLRRAGRERAAGFSWDSHFRQVFELIEQAAR